MFISGKSLLGSGHLAHHQGRLGLINPVRTEQFLLATDDGSNAHGMVLATSTSARNVRTGCPDSTILAVDWAVYVVVHHKQPLFAHTMLSKRRCIAPTLYEKTRVVYTNNVAANDRRLPLQSPPEKNRL